MDGILYGVGVGPGDPGLITLKAVEIIRFCEVIALPKSGDGESVALQIVRGALPEIDKKEMLDVAMPMTRDRAVLERSHHEAAQTIAAVLRTGKNIAFLTLGDPGIYSTYSYVHQRILNMGLQAQMIAGVPSFCAVGARLNIPLAEGAQAIHILPASYDGLENGLELNGTRVLMKSGRSIATVKEMLRTHGLLEHACMVSNCGMEGEQVFETLEGAEEGAGYFSIVIVKEGEGV